MRTMRTESSRLRQSNGLPVFVAGFWDGIGAVTKALVPAGRNLPKRYAPRDVSDDWTAVGRDLKAALANWKPDERA